MKTEMQNWLTKILNEQEMYYGSIVIDLQSSRWSENYLRQELRRRGYKTKLSDRKSRWLMVYKK